MANDALKELGGLPPTHPNVSNRSLQRLLILDFVTLRQDDTSE